MKKTIGLVGILLLGSLQPAVVYAAVQPPGASCPVMPGEKTKSKFYVDYKGNRHYLCCKGCVKKFKKNPEKYLSPKIR